VKVEISISITEEDYWTISRAAATQLGILLMGNDVINQKNPSFLKLSLRSYTLQWTLMWRYRKYFCDNIIYELEEKQATSRLYVFFLVAMFVDLLVKYLFSWMNYQVT